MSHNSEELENEDTHPDHSSDKLPRSHTYRCGYCRLGYLCGYYEDSLTLNDRSYTAHTEIAEYPHIVPSTELRLALATAVLRYME